MITNLEEITRKSRYGDSEYYDGNWIHIKKNQGITEKERERRNLNHMRKAQKEASLSDVQRYYISQNKYMIDLIRRYRRHHDFTSNEVEGSLYPVKLKEALEMGKSQNELCHGCNRYYDVKFVFNKICKNCSNLPLHYFPLINGTPNVVEKYKVNENKETTLKVHRDVNINRKIAENDGTKLVYFDKEFIEFVRENRIKMNLTQEQFARRINYNSNIIRDLERGTLLYDANLKTRINEYFV